MWPSHCSALHAHKDTFIVNKWFRTYDFWRRRWEIVLFDFECLKLLRDKHFHTHEPSCTHRQRRGTRQWVTYARVRMNPSGWAACLTKTLLIIQALLNVIQFICTYKSKINSLNAEINTKTHRRKRRARVPKLLHGTETFLCFSLLKEFKWQVKLIHARCFIHERVQCVCVCTCANSSKFQIERETFNKFSVQILCIFLLISLVPVPPPCPSNSRFVMLKWCLF